MKISFDSKNYCDVMFKDQKKRDLLLILPGGYYQYTSPREAVPVANTFMDDGLHAAIFYYREDMLLYDGLMDEALSLLKQLNELDQVNHVHVIGFSAGGHYAAMMMTKFNQYIERGLLIYPAISVFPKNTPKEAFSVLLGENITDEGIKKISPDLQVNKHTPPTFLMHSVDDQVVSVDNSIKMLNALKKHHVYVEAHFYPTGDHGISINTKEVVYEKFDPEQFMKEFGYIASWVDLAKNFIKREIK